MLLGGAFAVLLAVGVGWGVTRASSTPHAPDAPHAVQLDFQPDEAELRALEELRARLSPTERRFPIRDARKKDNAKLFTYMAATSTESTVVEAALEAMRTSYSPSSTKKQTPDADVDRVLLKYLASDDERLLGAALAAARIPLMGAPSAELLGRIRELAGSESRPPAVRYAAVEVLNLVPPERRTAEFLATLGALLSSSEAYLVSAALDALGLTGTALGTYPERAREVSARVVALTEHPDPGVRGRALIQLSALDAEAEASKRALAALADPHPYVRSAACAALATVGRRSAIHHIVEQVGDKQPAVYELSVPSILGEANSLVHVVPGRASVSESALYALGELSGGELPYRLGARHTTAQAWDESIAAARAWYEKVAPSIPREP